MAPVRLLVTGGPQAGKTSLCAEVHRRLTEALPGADVQGFFAHGQQDDQGQRVAFECSTADGAKRALLATVEGPPTGSTVGEYNVHVQDFESLAIPVLDRVLQSAAQPGPRLCIVDEIGPMESHSEQFCQRVHQLLESHDEDLHVLAAVAQGWGAFVADPTKGPRVDLVEVGSATWDADVESVSGRLHAALVAGGAAGGLGGGAATAEATPGGEPANAAATAEVGGSAAAPCAGLEQEPHPKDAPVESAAGADVSVGGA